MNTELRHNYEYKVNTDDQYAASKVARFVGKGKRVLEIGAGPGSITRVLQKNDCTVVAIELDATAIEKLSQYCQKVYQADLNSNDWVKQLKNEGKFDVLVAADVLEHLYWPQRSLQALKPFFAKDGYLVVSLPHVGNNAIVASILDEDFEYQERGLLDETHIRFFGVKNMQDLFERTGYKILDAEFVIIPPAQTELAHHWKKLKRKTKRVLSSNKYGMVYQVVMKIVPDSFPGTAINLLDLPVQVYSITLWQAAKAMVGPHLSPNTRQLIKKIIRKRDTQ